MRVVEDTTWCLGRAPEVNTRCRRKIVEPDETKVGQMGNIWVFARNVRKLHLIEHGIRDLRKPGGSGIYTLAFGDEDGRCGSSNHIAWK